MSQLSQWAQVSQSVDYFSDQRIIDGNVFNATFSDAVAFTNVAAQTQIGKILCFGGLADDYLVRGKVSLDLSAGFSSSAAPPENKGSLSVMCVFGALNGAAAATAAVDVFCLNDPTVVAFTALKSDSAANFPASVDGAPTNRARGAADGSFSIFLPAGEYVYIMAWINEWASGTDNIIYFMNASFTLDNMG